LAQHTQQQLASTTAIDPGAYTGPLEQLLGAFVLHLLQLWQCKITATPALVPAVVRTLLPLVQQLQSCGPQLLEAAAAAAARGLAYQQGGALALQTTFLGVQQTAAALLFKLDSAQEEIMRPVLDNPPLEADVAQQVQNALMTQQWLSCCCRT
jgi:hypothetical protein